MEEEIVVDDVDDNHIQDPQLSDDSSARVMPLLYIQQGKLHSAQNATSNPTVVSSNATQLAAIINPTNNSVNLPPFLYATRKLTMKIVFIETCKIFLFYQQL